MTLLTKEVAAQLDFPEGLNDGFLAPALAYAIGETDFYAQIGGGSMFSNFWIGSKDEMLAFAEAIAAMYSTLIPQMVAEGGWFDEECDDPSVLVTYWVDGDIAMVASITVNEALAGWGCEYGYIPHLYDVVQQHPNIEPVMGDGDDNGPYDLFFYAPLSHEQRLAVCTWVNDHMIETLEQCKAEADSLNGAPSVEQLNEYIAKLKKLHS